MAYYKTEQTDNGYRVVMTDYEGDFYVLETFPDKKQARDVELLLSMVESVWCYGGNKDTNRYIEKYCTDRAFSYGVMREYADTEKGFYLAMTGAHNPNSHGHADLGNIFVFSDGQPIFIDAGTG